MRKVWWPCRFCDCMHSWIHLIYAGSRQLWDIWFVWHYKASNHTRADLSTTKWQKAGLGRIEFFFLSYQQILDLQTRVRLCGAKLMLKVLRNTLHFYEIWFQGSGAIWMIRGCFSPRWAHLSVCSCRNTKKVYLEHTNPPAMSASLRKLRGFRKNPPPQTISNPLLSIAKFAT